MNRHVPFRAQRGSTLVVGLIMLVLITLMVTSAFTLSSTNLKSVGNMQFRNEALAAADVAIDRVMSSPGFYAATGALTQSVDIDNDGNDDYIVTIAPFSASALTSKCVRAAKADIAVHSSVTLGKSMSKSDAWNATYDIDATVTPTSSNSSASGATVHVHSGVRVLFPTSAAKDAACK